MTTPTQAVSARYDRLYEQMNRQSERFWDAMLLSERECLEIVAILNEKLPGHSNNVAHHLRQLLNTAVDAQRCEDALVLLKGQ